MDLSIHWIWSIYWVLKHLCPKPHRLLVSSCRVNYQLWWEGLLLELNLDLFSLIIIISGCPIVAGNLSCSDRSKSVLSLTCSVVTFLCHWNMDMLDFLFKWRLYPWSFPLLMYCFCLFLSKLAQKGMDAYQNFFLLG